MVSYIFILCVILKGSIVSANNFSLLSVGVGTRKKAILNIYSLGLFVSSPLEKQILKENPQGNALCKTIQSSNAQKAIELSFVMNLGPEKVSSVTLFFFDQ